MKTKLRRPASTDARTREIIYEMTLAGIYASANPAKGAPYNYCGNDHRFTDLREQLVAEGLVLAPRIRTGGYASLDRPEMTEAEKEAAGAAIKASKEDRPNVIREREMRSKPAHTPKNFVGKKPKAKPAKPHVELTASQKLKLEHMGRERRILSYVGR